MVSAAFPNPESNKGRSSVFSRLKSHVSGWAVSLLIHILILVILATITRISLNESQDQLVTLLPEEVTEMLKNIELETKVEMVVGNQGSLDELGNSQQLSTIVSQMPVNEIKIEVDNSYSNFKIPIQTSSVELPESNILAAVNTTGSTENPTGGVQGAVDRITFEIASSLKERKVLVVWLFDASLSLKKRRDAISGRFEKIYEQLGQLKATKDNALLTAITTFGKETKFLTEKPIADVSKLIELTKNIQQDDSGVEKVFSATSLVINKYKKYRGRTGGRRKIMIIIVTDERGDDYSLIENTIEIAQRASIPIYCIGDGAVFGREKGYVNWEFPDGTSDYIPVDQGPESIFLERLQIPFWGNDSWRMEVVASGFGPYALTRLCRESGGLYFVSSQNRSVNFDLETLRQYQPDYLSLAKYQKFVSGNKAQNSLVKASLMKRIRRIPEPVTEFRADTEKNLRSEITESQKPMAELKYGLQEILRELEKGIKDREKITSPRWQAGYDLAIGRVLAMHVRSYGYDSLLAEMKTSPKPFTNKKSNTWLLRPANNIEGEQKIIKMAETAKKYLNRIIQDHPETPWAFLAKEELKSPMGWKWRETNRFYPPEPKTPEERKALLLAVEQERREEEMQKQARGPRPKL